MRARLLVFEHQRGYQILESLSPGNSQENTVTTLDKE